MIATSCQRPLAPKADSPVISGGAVRRRTSREQPARTRRRRRRHREQDCGGSRRHVRTTCPGIEPKCRSRTAAWLRSRLCGSIGGPSPRPALRCRKRLRSRSPWYSMSKAIALPDFCICDRMSSSSRLMRTVSYGCMRFPKMRTALERLSSKSTKSARRILSPFKRDRPCASSDLRGTVDRPQS